MKIKCYTCDKQFTHCLDPGNDERLQPLSLGYCSWGCLLVHKDKTISRLHYRVANLEGKIENEKKLREYEKDVIEVRATIYQMIRSSKEIEKRVKALREQAHKLPLPMHLTEVIREKASTR
jgi:hypothetical protein